MHGKANLNVFGYEEVEKGRQFVFKNLVSGINKTCSTVRDIASAWD
jgi:hypothetical protein